MNYEKKKERSIKMINARLYEGATRQDLLKELFKNEGLGSRFLASYLYAFEEDIEERNGILKWSKKE